MLFVKFCLIKQTKQKKKLI